MATAAQIEIKPGRLFIGGKWVDSSSSKVFPTINPATGEVLTQLADAYKRDADAAVQAASRAFRDGPWTEMSAADRARVLWKIGDLIDKYNEELGTLETLDNGKPIFESRQVDLPMAAEVFRYYAGWATKIHGETLPVRGAFLNYTLREPVGVVAAIVPWNFPLLLASWKVAPALATGNTVVLKPSSETPTIAAKFAEVLLEAGFPPQSFSLLVGSGSVIGDLLVEHPKTRFIAFTGSKEVGLRINELAAKPRKGQIWIKRVIAEMGGKDAIIVDREADLDAAVKNVVWSAFGYQGQ